MPRVTGTFQVLQFGDEAVRAFVPFPLPPADPPLAVEGPIAVALAEATASIARLSVAADMVPDAKWFLYGFVRKEALITSQIEGTQATLRDVMTFEAGEKPDRPDDVREVCNYVAALDYARRELARPRGLPLTMRLLRGAHERLLKGARGRDKLPGEIRRSQNWVGGTRPGNARFVPPPPERIPDAISSLEKWIHSPDPLPPLIRAGLAHVQFETIHPFLDGNGRIGRLLIALLVEHWGLLHSPLLYLSVAFKRRHAEYYERLSAVRSDGDWEGWTLFFLECVRDAAEDAVAAAQKLFSRVSMDRVALSRQRGVKISTMRLFEKLPGNPVLSLPLAMRILKVSKPTATDALRVLEKARIIRETTGKLRDRIYVYYHYLKVLEQDTQAS